MMQQWHNDSVDVDTTLQTLKDELDLHEEIMNEVFELYHHYNTDVDDEQWFLGTLTLYVAYQYDAYRTYKDVADALDLSIKQYKEHKIKSKNQIPYTMLMQEEDLEYPHIMPEDILEWYASKLDLDKSTIESAEQRLDSTTIYGGAPRTIVAGCLWTTIQDHDIDMTRQEFTETLLIHPSCFERGVEKFQ